MDVHVDSCLVVVCFLFLTNIKLVVYTKNNFYCDVVHFKLLCNELFKKHSIKNENEMFLAFVCATSCEIILQIECKCIAL